MSRLEQATAALGLTSALLLSSCGSPEAQPAPDAAVTCQTDLANGYVPGTPYPADTIVVTPTILEPAVAAIATEQQAVGSEAIAIGMIESFCVQVGNRAIEATLTMPQGSALDHQIVFVENSALAGQVFELLDLPELADATVSTTRYGVAADDSGQIVREGTAISVVGQEFSGVGLYHNIVTERCQALDMTTVPPMTLDDTELYRSVKEAVCNSLGAAADRAKLDIPYEDYLGDYQGQAIGPDINSSGQTITYPVVSERQFQALAEN